MPLNRAVFLDRDGVINRSVIRDGRPYPPASVEDLELVPGARDALTRLRVARFHLIVVTNQPDIARGKVSRDIVEAIHARLAALLTLDDIRMCPHDDGDNCACRKPKPGMLVEAGREAGIDFGASFMVGDRWRDVEAGRRAGCRTIFVDCGYDEQPPADADFTVRSLVEAVDVILEVGAHGNL